MFKSVPVIGTKDNSPWSKIESSFGTRYLAERTPVTCLLMEWFRSRIEAKVVIEEWRKLYNEVRPHSSLGKMSPKAYVGRIGSNLNQGASLKN